MSLKEVCLMIRRKSGGNLPTEPYPVETLFSICIFAVDNFMNRFDPTTLEIYRALYTSVAEEMGIALRRTAFSPNIKERRDYSCAVFDAQGRVLAQGDHMPVHLGSMPMAVAAALREIDLQPGDVVALNDPFSGGTHLPDVTLVSGVWGNRSTGEGGKGKAQRHNRRVSSSSPFPFTLFPSSPLFRR